MSVDIITLDPSKIKKIKDAIINEDVVIIRPNNFFSGNLTKTRCALLRSSESSGKSIKSFIVYARVVAIPKSIKDGITEIYDFNSTLPDTINGKNINKFLI